MPITPIINSTPTIPGAVGGAFIDYRLETDEGKEIKRLASQAVGGDDRNNR